MDVKYNFEDHYDTRTKTLDLTYLTVIELPELPNDIIKLYCYNNKLTKLPELPDSLKVISCGNNKLTKFPKLPKGLEQLYCFVNKLTELPELPESLFHLSCWNNNLPYIDLNGYWKWYKEEHPDLWAAKQMGLY